MKPLYLLLKYVLFGIAVCSFTPVKPQTVTIYGANIYGTTPFATESFDYYFRVSIVTPVNTSLPAEIFVGTKTVAKTDSILLCDSFKITTYETKESQMVSSKYALIGAGFADVLISFAGNSRPPIQGFIGVFTGPYIDGLPSSNSTVDIIPSYIVNIPKGQKRVVSFLSSDYDSDSTYSFDSAVSNVFINPEGVFINKHTGNILINTENLPLGYHSVMYTITEYGNRFNTYSYHSENQHVFTVHVTDSINNYPRFVELLPKDSAGFSYITQQSQDTVLTYRTIFIKSGINNPTVKLNTLFPMASAPLINTILSNDSLYITAFIKPKYQDRPIPPKSVGLVIKYDDSLGKCHEELTSFYIKSNFNVGIKNPVVKKNSLIVYPNPITNVLFIEGLEKNGRYELYNQSGMMVSNGDFSGKIDVSSVQSGLYFLRIISEDQVTIQKIVKQ